jgi:hypothetical protein
MRIGKFALENVIEALRATTDAVEKVSDTVVDELDTQCARIERRENRDVIDEKPAANES